MTFFVFCSHLHQALHLATKSILASVSDGRENRAVGGVGVEFGMGT